MKIIGAALCLIIASIGSGEARAAWHKGAWHVATSDHFVIYSQDPIESLRTYAEKLERLDALLRRNLTGPTRARSTSDRLTIYALPDVDSLQRVIGSDSFGVGGIYKPGVAGSIALTARIPENDPAEDYAQVVLLHEYVHHFMLLNLPAAYPAWYLEGYAEFYSASRFENNGDISIGGEAPDRIRELMRRQQGSIADILAGKVKGASYFEARGWLLTHYLTLAPGRKGQLDAFLAGLAAGKSLPDAGKEAFGDLRKLDRDVTAWLHGPPFPYTRISAAMLKPGKVVVSEISPGEAAMMAVTMNSRFGVGARKARKLAAEARRIAAAYPDDPAVQCTMAGAENDAGNPDESDAAANRLLAINPQSYCGLISRGRAATTRGVKTGAAPGDKVWADARRWFGSALRVEPENPWSMWLYYESYRAAHAVPAIDAIALLYAAQTRTPQDPELRVIAATQLLRDGRIDDARTMVAPVLAYSNDARMRGLYNRIGHDDARSLADEFDNELTKATNK